METKFEKLEKLISELNISDKELISWVNNRSRDKTGLIPTELPLVYRRGNVLIVENGLNLNRKHELWGIQLLSGVMVALQRDPENNISPATWEEVKKFAEKMRFNGKSGFLPSKDVYKRQAGFSSIPRCFEQALGQGGKRKIYNHNCRIKRKQH